ncbi:HTH-type transcriptional repressor PurR [Caprobacter fermentans]|uniref:HTH-type transcriptional repressor PurR n=2 Tax=Caproicibacter fermentans TaxID=2576756 RepID=A0A6N8I0Q3_9FIRM|nr:HTH-type transcriptional repressor PurR [Caproicibacter fermentans]
MGNITMKDIAEKSNVSIATVSYILNHVKGQKISDETKKRVLTISKEMGYIPNLTARTLAGKKSGLIGILRVCDLTIENPWQDFIYCKFINQIERILNRFGYHVLFTKVDVSCPELNVVLQRKLDGVILLDVSEDIFYKISNIFHVPVLIIDGYLEDCLFHKIILDYNVAFEKSEQLLNSNPEFIISYKSNNKGILNIIDSYANKKGIELLFAKSVKELAEFSRGKSKAKGIVINEFVSLFAARYLNPNNFVTVCSCGSPEILPESRKKIVLQEEKSEVAADLILSYIKGDYQKNRCKYTFLK